MKNNYPYQLIVLCCSMLFATVSLAQNVGINATGNTPDSSAMLDIASTDKGLLIPRMDSTSRMNIAGPAKGLMVFDSTYNSFWYYNGAAWTSIGGGSGGDNLGNHIANQNLQLNSNWLNNDGGANEGIYIDADGQVGIGTTPSSTFHVSMGTNLELNAGNTSIDDTYSGNVCQSFTPTKTGELHSFQLQTSGTAAVTYNLYEGNGTGGTLLAGPFSQANPQAAYLFSGITLTQGQMYTLEVVNPSANPYSIDAFSDQYLGGTEKMRIGHDGKVGIGRNPTTNLLEVEGDASKTTAGNWLANSDARLKKNISLLSSEIILEKMLSLQGVTYEWDDTQTGTKRPEGIQYGFIAQNIQSVFPSLVTEDNNGFLQTPYGTYDAMTVEAIRALNNKIEKLESENAQLKNQVAEVTHLKTEMAALKTMISQIVDVENTSDLNTEK